MTRRQADSDPLPYVQVDRAAKPKAALLATAIGVSNQHALGSLIEWWELCGDPRELELIIEATPANEEPVVLLSGDEASSRFLLASGKAVEPITLARLGLLEQLPEGFFRVRGMSRYFQPIKARARARKAASAGGKASVESRRKTFGTAKPRSAAGSESASAALEALPKQTPKRTPKHSRSDSRSGAEAGANPSGQRSAVSREAGAPDGAARPSDALRDDFRAVVGGEYLWQGAKDGVALAELLKAAPLEEVRTRWRRGLKHPPDDWLGVRTVAQLRSKWNDLATDTAPKQQHDPNAGLEKPTRFLG